MRFTHSFELLQEPTVLTEALTKCPVAAAMTGEGGGGGGGGGGAPQSISTA